MQAEFPSIETPTYTREMKLFEFMRLFQSCLVYLWPYMSHQLQRDAYNFEDCLVIMHLQSSAHVTDFE